MGRFCDDCGRSVGTFSQKRVADALGRKKTLCVECHVDFLEAREMEKARRPELAPGRESAPASGVPGGGAAEAGKKRVIMLGLAVLLAVVGGAAAFMLKRGVKEKKSQASSQNKEPVYPKRTKRPMLAVPIRPVVPRAPASAWDGKKTLSCRGGKVLTIENRHVKLPGTVIHASDNCRLTLVNCWIEGRYALRASGQARITIRGGRFIGTGHAAIRIMGDAEVDFLGGEIGGLQHALRLDNNARLKLRAVKVRIGLKKVGRRIRMSPRSSAINVRDNAGVVIEAGSIKGPGYGIDAMNNALLILREVAMSASGHRRGPEYAGAINLSGSAIAVVTGGYLEGPQYAIQARGNSKVLLRKVKRLGEFKERSNGVIRIMKPGESAPADLEALAAGQIAARAEHKKLRAYEALACDGVFDCYRKHKAGGNVSGRIAVTIDRRGAARRVKLQVPGASRKVVRCIKKVSKAKKIPNFSGPPGKLVCQYAGMLMGGSRILSISKDYVKARGRK